MGFGRGNVDIFEIVPSVVHILVVFVIHYQTFLNPTICLVVYRT